MQNNKFLLTVVLCCSIFFSYAQAVQQQVVQISGYVVNEENKPLAGVTVKDEFSGISAVSLADGVYLLEVPKAKNYQLNVSYVGYLSEKVALESLSFSIQQNFVLKVDPAQIEEVMVYGQTDNKKRIEDLRVSGYNVTAIDMNTYANTSANINQILKQVTGVTIRETGGLGSDFVFRINGLAAKVFIDGVPMENFGEAMTLNNIPVNLVDRIEVYKGVVPAHLGSDVLGGAVDIITKNKTQRFVDLSYSFGSFNTHQAALVVHLTDQKTGISIKANGFYNHSDNDYTMYSNVDYDVLLKKVENGKEVTIDKAKRFYDQYSSGMGQLEVGTEHRSWADRFFIGLSYSGNKKQNQLGATVNSVYGGLWSENTTITPTLRYQKRDFLTPRLFTDIFASYTATDKLVKDTAQYYYDWSGGPREGGTLDRTDKLQYFRYEYTNPLVRANFTYDLDEERLQSFNLNYNFNSTGQKTYNLLLDPEKQDVSGLPFRSSRHIVGLTWQGQWFSKRLIHMLAVKYYGMDASKSVDERRWVSEQQPNGDLILSPIGEIVNYSNYFGYESASLALRYRFNEDIGIKASVERAYNLPDMTGLFGDGITYLGNFGLKPERSDNLNLGFFTRVLFAEHHAITFDASGFYRKAKDFMAVRAVDAMGIAADGGDFFKYYNAPGVKLYGGDAELRYNYKNIWSLRANMTYDRAIDDWKYTDDSQGEVSITYGHQLPNRPWLYGNLEASWAHENTRRRDRLQFSYNYQYTDWYYLSWEHLGSKYSKDHIPAQFIHSLIGTYSWANNKYNISAEMRNILDDRTYDNFRLQKPGRAAYVKFRVSIM